MCGQNYVCINQKTLSCVLRTREVFCNKKKRITVLWASNFVL